MNNLDNLKDTPFQHYSSSGTPKTPEKISSPTKYYPFSPSLRVRFTPGVKKTASKIVYKIKNTKTGESYTGKTGNGLVSRTSSHLSGVRHPEKDYGKKPLYDAIRAEPENFLVGVQAEATNDQKLNYLEDLCIEANNSILHGYNKRRGGGGGRARSTPVIIPKIKKVTCRTPKKGYPLRRRADGKVRVQMTPTYRKTRNITYGFRSDDGKWLIGETEQMLRDRLYSYHHAFDHPEKDKGKLPLPTAVRLNPERFTLYVLHVGENVKGMEAVWIKAKDSIANGFNQRRGGGGPSSARQILFP